MGETRTVQPREGAPSATRSTAPPPAKLTPPSTELKLGGNIAAVIPQSVQDVFALAEVLAAAGEMVPAQYRGKPQETAVAILKGMEVGLLPLQSLQWMAVINGRPTIWGDAIPALLIVRGHFVDTEYTGTPGSDEFTATATLTRSDGRKVVRSFSWADAKRAQLAAKDTYVKYPQRMLMHRARTWAVRDGAPETLMGLEITEEVLDHVGPDNARDVTPVPARGGARYDDPAPDTAAAEQGGEPDDAEVVDDDGSLKAVAEAKAKLGKAALLDWYRALGADDKGVVLPDLPRLRGIAEKVDAAQQEESEPAPDRSIDFAALADGIRKMIADEIDRDDIARLYETELDAMSKAEPDMYKAIIGELLEASE